MDLNNIKRNMNIINSKNINDDSYLKIQDLYRKALDSYILNNSSIKKFDDEVSNANFEVIDISKKDDYQLSSFLGLKYVYVRNFLFIEKLDDDSLNYIIFKINNNDLEVDDKLLNIVKNTYRDIINDNYRHNEYLDVTNACYGSFIPKNIVPSNLLVFCIRVDNKKVELDKDSIINYINRKELLKKIASNIETTVGNELGIGVKVLIRGIVEE